MVQTIQAKNVDLRYLITHFRIQLVEDEQFFQECINDLPEVTELDKQLLDKVRTGYLNLLNYSPLLEDVVRMAVLDPIFFIGNFFLSPLAVKSEQSIDFAEEDEGVPIKGRIDTLVLKDQFWVMVIESKQASFSVEEGLAQLLAYLLGNPHPNRPSYGMITTGGSFIFVKLVNGQTPQYATSKVFATRNKQDLYSVLQILKRLSQIVIDS
jgi:hypothetical protein